jgi:amino-acid N-acetyltransferase
MSGSSVNTASTTTSTTVSTTYSTTTSSTTNINNTNINSNNKNDPFRGKGNQYYERSGPQSMNFRDGSRMAMFKDDAFRVAANAAAAAERDVVEEDDDNLIMEDVEMLMNNRTEVTTSAEGIAAATTTTTDDTQPNRSNSGNKNIINSGTSELSLDPKLIDFLPSDQVKEEEDLFDYTDNDVVNQGGEGAEPYISTQLLKSRLHDILEDTELGGFVKMFRGSASYIANHRGTIAVYHIPGELLAWEGFPGLMDDIALTWLLGMKIVLVAGCRHQIDLRLEEEEDGEGDDEDDRGYSGKVMMSSIRVTDEDTLRVVKEEAGFVRFEIERRLAKSLRLHGGLVKGSESLVGNVVSGNFYSAQPFGVIDGIDYCWTGFPRKVEVERIRQVHETNDIVLLTSLGVSPSGEIFNVNSEFLAATVAGAVSASKIVYFNVHGTSFQNKNTNKPVQNLRVSDAKNLLTHYNMKIHPKGFALVDLAGNSPQQQVLRTPGSMETLIKVGYSMVALEKGVKRAHILAPENGALVQELYTRDGCGTLISRDIYEGIRRADVNDVSGIYDLIDPLVRAGTLVPRPKSKLEKEITGYYVYTRDGLIVATGQLKRFEGGFAEIGCLVVNKDYRKGGRGDAMLGYLERLSLQCGAKKVFVLSTQTMDWFIERGFKEVSVESLPPSRQAMYNKKRKSKIYMKEIDGERDLDAAELWWSNQVSS